MFIQAVRMSAVDIYSLGSLQHSFPLQSCVFTPSTKTLCATRESDFTCPQSPAPACSPECCWGRLHSEGFALAGAFLGVIWDSVPWLPAGSHLLKQRTTLSFPKLPSRLIRTWVLSLVKKQGHIEKGKDGGDSGEKRNLWTTNTATSLQDYTHPWGCRIFNSSGCWQLPML